MSGSRSATFITAVVTLAVLTSAPLSGTARPDEALQHSPRSEGSDAPDVTTEPQTHVIYFVPSDKPDEELDTNGTIARSVDAILSWFASETASEGLPSIRPRFDRTESAAFDITFVPGDQPDDAYPSIDQIVDELVAKGFSDPQKRYLIYAATSFRRSDVPERRCAESYYQMPGFQELPYAVVHLDSPESCGARAFGTIDAPGKAEALAAHEWLHLEGVTPMLAPHSCAMSLYHVCTGPLWAIADVDEPIDLPQMDPEAADVMFPVLSRPLTQMVLDRDRDDYLDHGLPMYDLRDSVWFE